jgi:hypothetical protein
MGNLFQAYKKALSLANKPLSAEEVQKLTPLELMVIKKVKSQSNNQKPEK